MDYKHAGQNMQTVHIKKIFQRSNAMLNTNAGQP